MISFRYHLVSIIAVFLAIALGVVIGTTALNGAVVGDLRRQVTDLNRSNSAAAQANTSLQAQSGNADLLAQTFGSRIAGTALAKTPVVIVGVPGTSTAMKDAVAAEVVAAGGTVSGRLQLAPAFSDPARAGDIRSLATSGVHPIKLTLPTTDDPGTLAGALLGFVLLGHGQATDVAQVLAGFNTLDMMKTEGPAIVAGKAIIVVSSTSPAKTDGAATMLLSFVTELGSSVGGPTVVAGNPASNTNGGLVALVRASEAAKKVVSTVDDATGALGRLTVVLTAADAVAGRTGQYGNGAGADALLPGVSN